VVTFRDLRKVELRESVPRAFRPLCWLLKNDSVVHCTLFMRPLFQDARTTGATTNTSIDPKYVHPRRTGLPAQAAQNTNMRKPKSRNFYGSPQRLNSGATIALYVPQAKLREKGAKVR